MNIQIIPNTLDLIPEDASKDTKSRLNKFQKWLGGEGYPWYQPNLKEYRDHLLTNLSPASTKQHLATIRKRYDVKLRDNATRQVFYDAARTTLENDSIDDTPAIRKAFVDEIITRLRNDIDPENSKVEVIIHQDKLDRDHLRLTSSQASTLLSMPGLGTLEGLRDTAIIGLILCTGIREAELTGLTMDDLKHSINGELCLRIREGKGKKERGIPYGELDWILTIVERWLTKAGITSGSIFRGFKSRWMKTPSDNPMTTRAIQKILKKYPVSIKGELKEVKPHDLRRTYARLFYDFGGDLVALHQNLGHANIKTTLGYIGDMDINRRRAPAMLSFDLSLLNGK